MNKVPRGQTPERKAYMKAYNASHPKRDRRAYKAAYDASNRERIREYRAINRERLRAGKSAWYAANRERILARVKARSIEKRDQILSYQANYYAANTEKVKANVSAYRAANPEKKSALESRRRARKAGNGGSHTPEQRRAKFELFWNSCVYCGGAKLLTVDHDIPLKRGGTDDIQNILPSCRSCNSRKNARTAQEFINHQRTGGVGGEDKGR